jgi:hypothetical protein
MEHNGKFYFMFSESFQLGRFYYGSFELTNVIEFSFLNYTLCLGEENSNFFRYYQDKITVLQRVFTTVEELVEIMEEKLAENPYTYLISSTDTKLLSSFSNPFFPSDDDQPSLRLEELEKIKSVVRYETVHDLPSNETVIVSFDDYDTQLKTLKLLNIPVNIDRLFFRPIS